MAWLRYRARGAGRASEKSSSASWLGLAAVAMAAIILGGLESGAQGRAAAPSAAVAALPASGGAVPLATPVPLATARSEDEAMPHALEPVREPAGARASSPAPRPSKVAAPRVRVTSPNVVVARVELEEEGGRDYEPDALARDAAALSRAYFWVTDGHETEALSLLEHLAESGATPGIRNRASQLLIRASEAPASSSALVEGAVRSS